MATSVSGSRNFIFTKVAKWEIPGDLGVGSGEGGVEEEREVTQFSGVER